MQWFRSLYKEGPGVDRNEPEKKGIVLFWWIIKNNFFRLILLNMFFLLCCIPIVTIGPSLKALSKVTMDMTRMQPTSPISDFINEFKEGFWKSLGIGVVLSILVVSAIAYYLIPNFNRSEQGQYFLTVIISLILLLILAASMFIFKSLATIDLPVRIIIKNSILLVLISLKRLMLVFILVCIPTFIMVSNILYGLPLLILWQFSFNSVITSVISWGVMNKYIVLKNEEKLESAPH